VLDVSGKSFCCPVLLPSSLWINPKPFCSLARERALIAIAIKHLQILNFRDFTSFRIEGTGQTTFSGKQEVAAYNSQCKGLDRTR
jgi:hypothetical protein